METSLRLYNASFPLPSFRCYLSFQALIWPATAQISSPKSLSKFLNVSVSHSWSSIFNNNIGSGILNMTMINVFGEFRKKVAFPLICKLFPLPADTSSIRCNINKSAIYNNQSFSHSTEKVSNTIKGDKTCHSCKIWWKQNDSVKCCRKCLSCDHHQISLCNTDAFKSVREVIRINFFILYFTIFSRTLLQGKWWKEPTLKFKKNYNFIL